MTVEEKIHQMLIEHGMFGHHAVAVIEAVKSQLEEARTIVHWQDSVDSLPNFAMVSLWMTTKKAALAWIIQNQPTAFYRPMFEK